VRKEKRTPASRHTSLLPQLRTGVGITWKKNLCPPPREKSIIMILIYAPKVSLLL
jgi:hypothetical protein